ncbi:MAG: hypothetical protein DRQ43_07845 [Gammaproteobacteria bacterium]|nr:MAG: hypothetical protein DRQ43_07845 [Gammaproteobacteria bacterium]
MSQQTIRPTSIKPYSVPTASKSPIATKVDVEGAVASTTPLVLPTTDPLVAGSIWNDSGTVTVSAG